MGSVTKVEIGLLEIPVSVDSMREDLGRFDTDGNGVLNALDGLLTDEQVSDHLANAYYTYGTLVNHDYVADFKATRFSKIAQAIATKKKSAEKLVNVLNQINPGIVSYGATSADMYEIEYGNSQEMQAALAVLKRESSNGTGVLKNDFQMSQYWDASLLFSKGEQIPIDVLEAIQKVFRGFPEVPKEPLNELILIGNYGQKVDFECDPNDGGIFSWGWDKGLQILSGPATHLGFTLPAEGPACTLGEVLSFGTNVKNNGDFVTGE